MYDITVPIMLTAPGYDAAAVKDFLARVGAKRVLLSIPPLSQDNSDSYRKLETAIAYFTEAGFLTGVWFWPLWYEGDRFTPITSFGGASTTEKCPLDPDYLAFAQENIKRIAAMKPELILFDDDLRLGYLDVGYGCVCARHRALIGKYAGDCPDDVYAAAFSKKPNKYRDAFLRAQGDSLKLFCQKMREAANEVDPTIRIGLCGCISTWDADGVDSFTLAKILAGDTRPYLRLIGAPYWATNIAWGNRLQDVVELERMERAWIADTDAEIVSEGDTYPRPRFKTPASYLEIFDTALRFAGGMSGIMKYMLDYTASAAYDEGYLSAHLASADPTALTDGTVPSGVRVWEAMNKIAAAQICVSPSEVPDVFFSHAARMCACNGIPTVYEGTGVGGIVIGENARHLPKEALEKPLILDFAAARILMEQGVDLGIEADLGAWSPDVEYFQKENEYVCIFDALKAGHPFARRLKLKKDACVETEFVKGDERAPASYRYGRFLVLAVENFPETYYRNYPRARQLAGFLPLPAAAPGHPDLYLQCREGDGRTVIGVWNCHADAISPLTITLARNCRKADGTGAHASTDGTTLTLDKVDAFGFAYVTLTE